jgi:hypothetical protein
MVAPLQDLAPLALRDLELAIHRAEVVGVLRVRAEHLDEQPAAGDQTCGLCLELARVRREPAAGEDLEARLFEVAHDFEPAVFDVCRGLGEEHAAATVGSLVEGRRLEVARKLARQIRHRSEVGLLVRFGGDARETERARCATIAAPEREAAQRIERSCERALDLGALHDKHAVAALAHHVKQRRAKPPVGAPVGREERRRQHEHHRGALQDDRAALLEPGVVRQRAEPHLRHAAHPEAAVDTRHELVDPTLAAWNGGVVLIREAEVEIVIVGGHGELGFVAAISASACADCIRRSSAANSKDRRLMRR